MAAAASGSAGEQPVIGLGDGAAEVAEPIRGPAPPGKASPPTPHAALWAAARSTIDDERWQRDLAHIHGTDSGRSRLHGGCWWEDLGVDGMG